MFPRQDPASWERPFLALQNVVNGFVEWSTGLPGAVQLLLYPLALLLSLVHMFFSLAHLLIATVTHRVWPRELPRLTRGELREWACAVQATWDMRHATLREHNPPDVADDIALPVVGALRAVVHALSDDVVDCDQLNALASRLIDLPLRTAPDAHALGLCIQHHLASGAEH